MSIFKFFLEDTLIFLFLMVIAQYTDSLPFSENRRCQERHRLILRMLQESMPIIGQKLDKWTLRFYIGENQGKFYVHSINQYSWACKR